MSWQALTTDEVLAQSTPQESAAFTRLQGQNSLPSLVAAVTAEIRDDIRAGGYPLAVDETTIPFGLHNDAVNVVRWRLLISVPSLKSLQTEDRKDAADRAQKKLDKISAQKWAPEPPCEDSGSSHPAPARSPGSWNSENKLIMRTHPVPPPSVQYPPCTPSGTGYANPEAPSDFAR